MSGLEGGGRHDRPGDGYEALVSGAAVWEDRERTLVRVEGRRAAAALNGLLSADVEALDVGTSRLSFVLTARGRPLAIPLVIRLADAFLLDVDRASLPGLLEHFDTYLPPRFASVAVLEESRRLSVTGPRAAEVAGLLDPPGSVLRTDRAPEDGGGYDYFSCEGGPAVDDLASELVSAGAVAASEDERELWRIEMGIPRFGLDVTPDHLPQETGLVERAVSFDKGCYTGQEVVARIHYRGAVQRHLRGLEAASRPSGAPPGGTRISRGGREAGVVTSWCESPRFGPIGLAYVRREVAPGESVELESTPPVVCRVRNLPFTST